MRFFSGKCASTARLDGKTAVVTGSNCGIGKITVMDFYQRGARVIMACRNLEDANLAAEEIRAEFRGKENLGQIIVTQLDLASLSSVRNCAKRLLDGESHINLLINNAGVMACPQGKTQDGFEIQFGTNHLGHFLLTLLLLPKMVQSRPARIVTVSSVAHTIGDINFEDLNWEKQPYSPTKSYAQSKLANILFTVELARKIEAAQIKGLTVYSLHPGVIRDTKLARHLDTTLFRGIGWIWKNIGSFFMKSPEMGAQTTIYCAVDEKCGNETGLYYSDCDVTELCGKAKDVKVSKRLWDVSLELVGLDTSYNPLM